MKSFFSNVSQDLNATVLHKLMHNRRQGSAHETSADDDSTTQSFKRKSGPEEGSSSRCSVLHPTLVNASKKAKLDSLLVDPSIDNGEPTLQSEHIALNIPVVYPASKSPILNRLPSDVLQHALSFIASDLCERPSILRTCKMFHVLANSADVLRNVDLFQNHGRILFDFSSSSANHGPQGLMLSPYKAVAKLLPFAKCGNLQALYMIGMIRTYCNGSCLNTFHSGIAILNHAAKLGDVRSSYSLGLILRDGSKTWSVSLFNSCCDVKYMPACQEVMSASDIRERFGDLDAYMLVKYMDPTGLSRLLRQFYLNSPEIRVALTSHCWNPLCGRWAFKATNPPVLETNPTLVSTPSSMSIPQESHSRKDGPLNNSKYAEDCPKMREQNSSSKLHSLPSYPDVDVDSELHSILLQKKVDLYSSPFASSLFVSPSDDIIVTSESSDYLSPFHSGSMFASRALSDQTSNDEDEEDTLKMNRVSRMKMCSSCRRAKYCSKLCQVYDWRSGRHRNECHYLT